MDDGIVSFTQISDGSLVGHEGEEVVDPAVGRVADAGVAAVHERGTLGQDGKGLGDRVDLKDVFLKINTSTSSMSFCA